jgi:hypothetical protein
MKTRNSSGVGQKIDLGFDQDTLRIIDCDEDEDSNNYSNASTGGANSIVNSLKRTNTDTSAVREDPSAGANVGKVRAETDSTKLRSFLNNLGNE